MNKLSSLLFFMMPLIISCQMPLIKSPPALKLQQKYIVEWIAEIPLIDYSYLDMVLEKNNKIHGFAGCNYWQASYQLEGNRLQISNITSTKKYCSPALMEQEQRYLAALLTVTHWDYSPIQQLQLWPASGLPIRLWGEDIY